MRRLATHPVTQLAAVLAMWVLARAVTGPDMRTTVDVVGYVAFLTVGLVVYAKAVRAEERRSIDTRALDGVADQLDRITRSPTLTPYARAYQDGIRAAADMVRGAAHQPPQGLRAVPDEHTPA